MEKLEGAIKMESECILKQPKTSRAISRSITKEFLRQLEKTNQDNSCIRIHATHICQSRKSFSSAGLFITRLRTRLSDKSVNCFSFLHAYFKSK